MKRCPTCSRVYDDVSLRFCLDDGTALVNKAPDAGAPATAVLPASSSPAPTIEAAPPAVAGVPQHLPPTAPAAGKKSLTPWFIGGGLILFVLVATIITVVLLLPKPPLKWHLTMAVVAPQNADQNAVVSQTVSVIKSRLNAAGVSHFEIRPQGNQIFLDLPNVKDPERIKLLISTGGKLELVHVISPPSPSAAATYSTQEEALASLNSGGIVPANRRVLPDIEREDVLSTPAKKWVVVESPAIVNSSDLRDASAAKSSYSDSYDIRFTLNKAGAARFGAWTGANINEYLGIVLNDEVKSIAYIKSQIMDQGEITGRFTRQAAEDLALVLKAGALPARVEFLEERVDK